MRVIDILNEISNNELPHNTRFKIISPSKVFNCIYDKDFCEGTIWVINNKGKARFNYQIDFMKILNYEVEIIEESEKIEEASINRNTKAIDLYDFIKKNMCFNEAIELYKLLQNKMVTLEDKTYDYNDVRCCEDE